MLSTNSINQQLSQQLLDADDNEKKSETTLPLIFQFIFNMLTTFGRTGLPTAMLITEAFQSPILIAKMGWQGIAIATPVAIFLSLCESKVHDVESKHFERTKKKNNESKQSEAKSEEQSPSLPITTEIPAQVQQPQPPVRRWYQTFLNNSSRPFEGLSWYQTILSCGHYLCDVSSGMEFPIMAAKLSEGFDDMDTMNRVLIYLGILGFSCAGNWQELKNAITAFQEDNAELNKAAESRHNSPRPS